MSYGIRKNNGNVLLMLRGEIRIQLVCELAEKLTPMLADARMVSVDAKDVKVIDSCMLQLLCSVEKSVERFAVRRASGAFREAAERVGLGQWLASCGEVVRAKAV